MNEGREGTRMRKEENEKRKKVPMHCCIGDKEMLS
jgi:hypothetical protein